MSVDMYEHRFREELMKLERFEPDDRRDPRVWGQSVKFPAWRALFTSQLLYGHSTGYRLPSFGEFYTYVRGALTNRHPERDRYQQFFYGELSPGMRQRIGAWYESGMAETYLYVCLVEAIEDKTRAGIVLYDARADWKLKADAFVLIAGKRVQINAFTGLEEERQAVEQRRDRIERGRKVNTPKSAHWDNMEIAVIPKLVINRTDEDQQEVNGVRLFSAAAINRLLRDIYRLAGVADGHYFRAPKVQPL